MNEVILSASLVTSMLAVLIERQFMIFSILFKGNVPFCGFRRAMSNRSLSYIIILYEATQKINGKVAIMNQHF